MTRFSGHFKRSHIRKREKRKTSITVSEKHFISAYCKYATIIVTAVNPIGRSKRQNFNKKNHSARTLKTTWPTFSPRSRIARAVVGLSTVYFRKLFSVVMGVSPINYARSLRLEKAQEMLKSDYGSLSDVATSLGYPSLYDFSRDFKKHTGSSPLKI